MQALAATNGAPHLPGSASITRFLYDGDALVAEYDGAGTLTQRYMHGPGVDKPILWDIGQAMNCSGTRFLHTNHQGSIVAVADCNGNRTNINSYDEYGIPAGLISGSTPNTGRFQYTGQTWIPEIGCYYYKARFYCPTLGRFMQTDPIGYEGGINIYAYAENDPINNSDPSGLITAGSCAGDAKGNVSASCSGGNVISATDAFREQQANAGAQRPSAPPPGAGPGAKGQPKPSPNFITPTNSPRNPPPSASLPPGNKIRIGPPTQQYPNGYWVQTNAGNQPVDPSTRKPPSNVTSAESRSRTHVPLPENESEVTPSRAFIFFRVIGAGLCLLFCESPAK